MIINFGGRQTIHQIGRPQEPLFFQRSWVSGLQTACLEVESPTPARLIAASLRPAYAGPLLGVCGQDITNRVVPLDAVLAGLADDLAGRLEGIPSVAGRFLLFEDFLRERIRSGRRPHPTACRAANRIFRTGGQIAARELKEELGCSARYLEKQLGEQIGLAPKQLARLVRFSRSVEQIRRARRIDWGRIAAYCGYYDQPHFNRDFRLFTGATPTEFLALRDPSTQAMMVE
ncbi:MAG: helix-turn-helix domain-containing protein [Vicinamibacterales bacterium]|nr:helix-turn-helix domain-containing protein [Vicinamibacterales bacterium]